MLENVCRSAAAAILSWKRQAHSLSGLSQSLGVDTQLVAVECINGLGPGAALFFVQPEVAVHMEVPAVL